MVMDVRFSTSGIGARRERLALVDGEKNERNRKRER
jgi:hypothetical protein